MAAGRPRLATSGLPQISEAEGSATASPARKVMAARILNMAARRSDEQGKEKINAEFGNTYPLDNSWDFWHDRQDRKPKGQKQADSLQDAESLAQDIATASYEDRLVELHSDIKDVKKFWEVWNSFEPVLLGTNPDPGQRLQLRDSIHLFHHGTKPVWEDPRNVKGGSWTFRVPKEKAPKFWQELCLMAIGSQLQQAVATKRPSFNDDICGISYSIRFTSILVTIWNRDGDNQQGVDNMLKVVRENLSPELVPSQHQYYYKKHSEHAGFTGTVRGT